MSGVKPTAADKWILDTFKLQLEKTRRDIQSLPQTLFPCDVWTVITHYATEDPLIIDAMQYSSHIQAGMHIDLMYECDEDGGVDLSDDGIASSDENMRACCLCVTHFILYFRRPGIEKPYRIEWGAGALSILLEMHDFSYNYLNHDDNIDRIALMRSKLYSIIEHHIKPSRAT